MEEPRALRADALRNRRQLLQVAYETFASEGLSVPIDEIARRAGVGAGTVSSCPVSQGVSIASKVRVSHALDSKMDAITSSDGSGFST